MKHYLCGRKGSDYIWGFALYFHSVTSLKVPRADFFCSCTFSNHLTESHRRENFDVSVLFQTKVILKANQVTGCHLRMTPCSHSEALQEK